MEKLVKIKSGIDARLNLLSFQNATMNMLYSTFYKKVAQITERRKN